MGVELFVPRGDAWFVRTSTIPWNQIETYTHDANPVANQRHKQAWRVFISHASKDDDRARELADRLRAADYSPFVVSEQLLPGENWRRKTGEALEKSDVIIFLVSDEATQSPWIKHEWEFALGSRKHAGRVLPVLLPGTAEDAMPWIMKRFAHVKPRDDWDRMTDDVVAALKRITD